MNLLPDTARKHVAAEYRRRALLVGASLFLFVAFIALLALLPAVFVVSEQREVDDFATLESRFEQLRKDRVEAQEAQALLAALSPVATSTVVVERVVKEVLSLRPSGVFVNAIAWNSENVRTLVLSGTSQNREALNTYRARLEELRLFQRVAVPVSALVGSVSGFFSITLTLN